MPDIDYWIDEIADVGEKLHDMGAAEAGAGNISVFLPEGTTGLRGFGMARFARAGAYKLSRDINLPHGTLLITGTRKRLRDIKYNPDAVLCAIVIERDGSTWLHRSKKFNVQPTTEIDSHAGIHAVALAGAPHVSAVVHAQPPNLTYLTHLKEYREPARFNRQLLRWLPETIAMLPNGIRILPFEVPGTPRQGELTRDAMVRSRILVWAKHGVIARSLEGPLEALDLIEYAEAAATYERFDLQAGRIADGLSLDELRAISKRFDISTPILDKLPEDVLPPMHSGAGTPR